MSFSSSRKARPGEPGPWVKASKDRVFEFAKRPVPKVGHSIPEHTGTEGRLGPADKVKPVTPAGRFDQPQLNQRRFQAVFVAFVAGGRLSGIGADETGDISSNSGDGSAAPLPVFGQLRDALDQ